MGYTPQSALAELKTLNKQLAARSKKLKDSDGAAIAKKVDAAIKTFDGIVASDAKLTKSRADLSTAINVHNGALGKAAGEIRKVEDQIGKLTKGEPNPRVYIVVHPLLGILRNMPIQPPM